MSDSIADPQLTRDVPPSHSRLITVAAFLLVVVLTPAWVDPTTIAELTGRLPTPTVGGLPTPDPITGRLPLTVRVPPFAGPPIVVARDTFARSVDSGWGTADKGGAYSVSADIVDDLSVVDEHGFMRLATSTATRSVVLPAVSVHDVEVAFSVSMDRLPAGGNVYVYALVRATDTGAAYRPKLFVTSGGGVYAHAGVILAEGERSLGPEILVANTSDIAARVFHLRAYVAGSDPTSIFVKVWDESQPEPPYWQFGAIDFAGKLQRAGTVGVTAYLGRQATNPPIVVRISDLTVTATDPSR